MMVMILANDENNDGGIVVMVEMVLPEECPESTLSHWISARPRIRKDGFQLDNSLVQQALGSL